MSDEQPKGEGELVRQAHGGALKRGGVNKGSGRPPAAIRADCRTDFDKVRPRLVTIALSDAKKWKGADILKAIELLGKYALDESINRSDVAAALQGTIEDIRSFLSPMISEEQLLALLSIIRPRWRGI